MASWWDSFIHYFKPESVAPTMPTVSGSIATPAANPKTLDLQAQHAIAGEKKVILPLQTQTSPFAENQLANANKWTGDVIRTVAEPIGKAFSYAVNRPISTAGLISDPTSVLYKKGTHGEGFQFSDIGDAWNRSAKVSPMQSLVTAGLHTHTSGISEIVLGKFGNIDTNKIDVWDDKNIEKNFVNNPIGTWYTGIGDFALSIPTGNFAIKGLAKIGGAAKVAAGMGTKVASAEDLVNADVQGMSHIQHVETGGAQGQRTVFGQDIEDLSKTSDPYLINIILQRQRVLNKNVAGLVSESQDMNQIKDILLASKGYVPAFERLQKTAPADLWATGNMNETIAGKVVTDGGLPKYDADSLLKVNAAYDDSIKKAGPSQQKIYDAFITGKSETLAPDVAYINMEPKIGSAAYMAYRSRSAELRAAANSRDFSNIGGIAERVLGAGNGRPATVLLRFTGTSLPKYFISYSSIRPLEAGREFQSMLDSSKLLANGKNEIITATELINGNRVATTTTAAEYRKDWLSRFTNAATDIEKSQVIKDFETQFPQHVALTHGFEDLSKVDEFVKSAKLEQIGLMNALKNDGFGFDHTGVRMVVDPQTQRQLIDSQAVLPLDTIENAIRRAGKKGATLANGKNAVGDLLGTLNHYVTATQLLRPSYIPKNSFVEPLVSATLSQGIKFFTDNAKDAINMAKETNLNRFNYLAARKFKGQDKLLKQLNQEAKDLTSSYAIAVRMRDTAMAEYEHLLSGNVSPLTRSLNMEAVQYDLRQAEHIVADIETRLDAAMARVGAKFDIPSVYELKRRIDFLKTTPGGAVQYGSEISKAEMALAKTGITGWSLDKNVADSYKELDKIINNLGENITQKGEVLSGLQKFKERRSIAELPQKIIVGGQEYTIAGMLDRNYFGAALKNEISNLTTQEMNLFAEHHVGIIKNVIDRMTPGKGAVPTDAIYFEELAFLVNRQMRGDILQNQILGGASRGDLYKWATTPEGVKYIKSFGIDVPITRDVIKNFIDTKFNYNYRYLPDAALRQLVLEREVTSADLGKYLGNKLNELTPIHPHEHDYPSATFGKASIIDMADNAAINLYKGLMMPENPIRRAWVTKEFPAKVQQKAQLLSDQGVSVTLEMLNDLRIAASREVVTELEKTFYTVNRHNRALWLGRFAVSYPTATASGLYRYGRLAVKNPGRMAGFLRYQYGFYNSFGVDRYGNPVDDPSQAEFILIPGTKEMGFNNGRGLAVGVKSLAFLANSPGPSVWTNLSVHAALAGKPDLEITTKHIIDSTIGHIPGFKYEDWFPTGASKASSTAPPWAANLWQYMHGDESNKDFLSTMDNIANYQMGLWEMHMGPKPTHESIMRDTKAWFLEKAGWNFLSPIGVTPKQEVPGSLIKDYASVLKEKYKGDPEWKKKVEWDLLTTFGSNFPASRYTISPYTSAANISPTLEGEQRVWKNHSDLAKKLANIATANGDVSVIGLMTADITGNPDIEVSKFLIDPSTRLPDGTKLNAEQLSPDKFEIKLNISRGWDKYTSVKNTILESMKSHPEIKSLSAWPAGKAAMSFMVSEIKKENPDWGNDYDYSANGDKSWYYAKGMKTIVNDSKFMAKNSKNDYFQQMKSFVAQREMFVQAYNAAQTGSKSAIRDAWLKYVKEDGANLQNAQLQQVINRYFANDNMKEAG